MNPLQRLEQLLAWCRIPADPREWDHATAERCRQQLPRIAAAGMKVRRLPPMFSNPFSRYLNNDPSIGELFDDDDRLLLMLSDLVDYLSLMKRGYM